MPSQVEAVGEKVKRNQVEIDEFINRRGVTRCPDGKAKRGGWVQRITAPAFRVGDRSKARWYVVSTTIALGEYKIAKALEEAGFAVWLPECMVRRQLRRRVMTLKGPLFPGYLFAHLDLESDDAERDEWGFVEGVPGVDRLLRRVGSDMPCALSDAQIAQLRAMAADGGGLIVIDDEQVRRAFKRDQPVLIEDGAFAGWRGLYVGIASRERVKILLDVLGAARVVKLPEALVMPA